MRVSDVSNATLANAANVYRELAKLWPMSSKETLQFESLAGVLEELIDRRNAEGQYRNAVEASLAYELAAGMVENRCTHAEPCDEVNGWYDLDDVDSMLPDGLDMEVEYLTARGLIQRHPDHPNWIAVLDESEATS